MREAAWRERLQRFRLRVPEDQPTRKEFDIVLGADISPDLKHAVLGGPGRVIKLWDTVKGEQINAVKKHTDWLLTAAYSPESNGIAERCNRTIMEKVRCMMHWAKAPTNLWAEAAVYACNLRNVSRVLAFTTSSASRPA